MSRHRPRSARRAWLLALALFAAALGAACSSGGDTCSPGDQEACSCHSGEGHRTCGDDGSFGVCVCESHLAGAGGAGGGTAATGAGGSGKLPFMSTCTDDAQCESGLCFDYTTKGPHCTITCTMDSQCPPPSPGCNGKGVCRAP